MKRVQRDIPAVNCGMDDYENQVMADLLINMILPSGMGIRLPDKIRISTVAPSIILFSKTKVTSATSVAA